jgi:hypothetical protein
MVTMNNWTNLDAANKLVYSLKEPIASQLVDAVYFELETGISKDLIHAAAPFDCLFFARAIIRLFSDHAGLNDAVRGASASKIAQASWPNFLSCIQVAEAIEFCESNDRPPFRSPLAMLAIKHLSEELSEGSPPQGSFDVAVFLKLISNGLISESFLLGVLDGLDLSIR